MMLTTIAITINAMTVDKTNKILRKIVKKIIKKEIKQKAMSKPGKMNKWAVEYKQIGKPEKKVIQ